ncbi:MAG: UvrD-helicase domain-containing protein [Clostridia bacterium]|nr:UvrD-helicase domain-containing protein [Clostridia bacterium]
MTRWTDEQLKAIEDRGHSILLSAAAGSGKTTVLVERVLRLIAEDGADVDRMLVVTFTRAAASDMRAKLSRSLSERAARGDARCREQLMRLDRASISTLHAFCADFLRTNFEAAGVDPAFRVMDDALSDRLRQAALDEALEAAYTGAAPDAEPPEDGPAPARPSEDLLALDYGRGPAGVRAAVEELFDRLEDRPDPEAWLARAVRCDDDALTLWQDELKDAARRCIGTAVVQLKQALNVAGCPVSYDSALRLDIAALLELQRQGDYDQLSRGIAEFRLTAARKDKMSDPDAVEAVKRLREAAKRALAEARITQLPLTTAREDARRLSGQIRTLSEIALNARALYAQKKDEQAGLTYADLERRTLEALRNPDVARLARERYDYVFVDEYQDTSDIQEAIVSAIRRPDNLFMVGDVKQSIYRFRLAEPRLFLEKYAAYARGEGGRLMPLTRNFRSRRGILDFVNMVFERAMTGGDSEIVYDRLARLNPGDPEAPASDVPDVDIRLIESAAAPEGEADEAIAEMKGVELEAALIARTIRDMMQADSTLRYRDFAILTRSKSVPFAAMMPVLLSAGIPAYADGAAGYYESVEITWTLSMLRLLDNRRLDVELIGILRSPVVGLSADALARVRIAYRDMPYCDAAAAYAEEQSDDIAMTLRHFFDRYALWRLKSESLSLGEFVRLVLDESGFYTYVGALPGGAQRQANLDQFVVSANRFDQEQSGSLSRFLRYTEHLRAKGDGDAAHLLGENDDVVRMMTVHKSKGLEFRVVFGAQLNKRFRVERSSSPLLTHRDLGVGMQYIDPDLRTRRLTLPQAAIIERGKRENAAEELRILYVLMTRARQHLVLVGTVRDADAALKRWRALADVPFAASSHLDTVMAARQAALAEERDVHSILEWIAPGALNPGAMPDDAGAGETLGRILAAPQDYSDEALRVQMAWAYPNPEDARKPLKLTASGLLRELEGPEAIPALTERPQFMAGDARHMTGAERGTAYHRAMQLIDLEALDGLADGPLTRAVAAQLDDFAARRLMTPVQRQAVVPGVLARFLSGDMGQRLRRAETVRREWPFNVSMTIAEALTPREAGDARFPDDELLVQGTVDCCFIEDGQWVLLDYKTDRADDPDALRERYRAQLGLYALALERITGIPVKQRALCLIGQGKTLEV